MYYYHTSFEYGRQTYYRRCPRTVALSSRHVLFPARSAAAAVYSAAVASQARWFCRLLPSLRLAAKRSRRPPESRWCRAISAATEASPRLLSLRNRWVRDASWRCRHRESVPPVQREECREDSGRAITMLTEIDTKRIRQSIILEVNARDTTVGSVASVIVASAFSHEMDEENMTLVWQQEDKIDCRREWKLSVQHGNPEAYHVWTRSVFRAMRQMVLFLKGCLTFNSKTIRSGDVQKVPCKSSLLITCNNSPFAGYVMRNITILKQTYNTKYVDRLIYFPLSAAQTRSNLHG